MRNFPKVHPGLALSFLAAATASLVPLASCASTGIADLYMSSDTNGARTQSVFYGGQPVNCILKMASGRTDETLLISFRPLEANGEVLDLPAQLVSNTAPGKTSGEVATLFPPPAVIAFDNPALANNVLVTHEDAALMVTAADASAVNNQIALLTEIRAKMLMHFADAAIHKVPDDSGNMSPPDAKDTPGAVAEAAEVRRLFTSHIGNTMFHDFPDVRNVPTAPVPDAMAIASLIPSISTPAFQAFSVMLNELSKTVNAHIRRIVQNPKQTAGKYRCEVDLAGEKRSVDFVILAGGIAEPPNTTSPRVGMCNGDPVASCPDPMKGPNFLRCCTTANSCGAGPKGTPFCY